VYDFTEPIRNISFQHSHGCEKKVQALKLVAYKWRDWSVESLSVGLAHEASKWGAPISENLDFLPPSTFLRHHPHKKIQQQNLS
jgi:hypothetical protein